MENDLKNRKQNSLFSYSFLAGLKTENQGFSGSSIKIPYYTLKTVPPHAYIHAHAYTRNKKY